MDDWLTPPANRPLLPVGRLCVIMALTVLLLVVTQARDRGVRPPDAAAGTAG